MSLIQLLAAEWAGVDEVVFHTGTDRTAALARATDVVASLPNHIAIGDLRSAGRPRL